MPKKFIQRYLPEPSKIKKNKALKIFGHWLTEPNLWCLNRYSAAMGFAIGLFMAFIPLPTQMIMATGLAILFRANLPLSVSLVFVTNPITIPFVYYAAYKVGIWILNQPEQPFHFEMSWHYIGEQLSTIGPPFLLGSFIFAVISALAGYFIIDGLWRYSVVKQWKKRQQRAKEKIKQSLKNDNEKKAINK